jgi:hypothetical protein
MVDDRDEQYDGEEGEYHFSDDQVNYDLETDTQKIEKQSAPSRNIKEIFLTKVTEHRKILISVVVFLVLTGVVYKVVVPSTTIPSTQITETTHTPETTHVPSTPPSLASSPAQNNNVQMPVNQPAPPGVGSTTPPTSMAVAPASTASNNTVPTTAATGQSLPGTVSTGMTSASTPPPGATATTSLPPGMIAPAGVVSANPASGQPVPVQPAQELQGTQQSPDIQTKNILERLASLEQQNAAMMNLLQTEYAQKISDYETQSTASRGKMEELTKRLNRLESMLGQLTQMMQNGRQSEMIGTIPVNEASKAVESKMTYSVQAIIPGRAWLKSESGETITVAEGDILRNYGRITKIDPYDGVVNIDTGSKVITLSYGMSTE